MEENREESKQTTEASEQSELDILKAELDFKQQSLQELESRVLRLHADMDNMRRRLQRERDDMWTVAVADCLSQMLPVLDNFDRALKALPDNDWARGIVMVSKQLSDILARMGLEPIRAEGAFDPQYHEAIMQDNTSTEPENTITGEFERGFCFKGKVLRPSKVRVSTGG